MASSSSSTSNTTTPPSGNGGNDGLTGAESTGLNPIGYCHSCDRQVEIDRENFSCTVCNGGFIELFDIPPTENSSGGATSGPTSGDQMRHINIQINDGDFSTLVPTLLTQLLNPNLFAASLNSQQPNSSQTAPEQSNTQQQQARQGPTRLQFVVPGEQVDLYGIINNVFSGVLDPRRQANMPQGANFQFQGPMRMFQLHGDMRDYAWGASGLDTIITQLLNQLENTGPPPASDEQLRSLPVVVITKEEIDKNVQCAICMEDFKLNDEAKRLPCKHYFHESCINEWLKLHGTCPVCRKNLNGEDTSQREYIRPPVDTPNNPSTNNNAPGGATATFQQIDAQNLNTPANSSLNNNNNNSRESGNRGGNNGTSGNNNVYHDMEFD